MNTRTPELERFHNRPNVGMPMASAQPGAATPAKHGRQVTPAADERRSICRATLVLWGLALLSFLLAALVWWELLHT
jgi:hypothetical protein